MTGTQFQLGNFISASEARNAIFNEAREQCELIEDKVELGMTNSGVVLRLYNQDKRPTVYHVEIKTDRYGNAQTLTLDTIVCEVKDAHEMLKVSFNCNQASHIINVLKRLSTQPCNGNKADTLTEYTEMGLLYWKEVKSDPAHA